MDQIPCTLDRCVISALITVPSTVFRKKKWTSAHYLRVLFPRGSLKDPHLRRRTRDCTNAQRSALCLGVIVKTRPFRPSCRMEVSTVRRTLLRTVDLLETTSMFFRQSYGWPLAPLGTCEVIRFRTNSPIKFLTAPSPMPAKPLKTTSEAPRSEEG